MTFSQRSWGIWASEIRHSHAISSDSKWLPEQTHLPKTAGIYRNIETKSSTSTGLCSSLSCTYITLLLRELLKDNILSPLYMAHCC